MVPSGLGHLRFDWERGTSSRDFAVPHPRAVSVSGCCHPLSIPRGDAKTKKPPERAALPLIVGTVDDQNFTRAPPITASKSSICSLPLTHEAPPVAQLASAEKCRQLRASSAAPPSMFCVMRAPVTALS